MKPPDATFDALCAGSPAGATARIEQLSSGELLFERSAGVLRAGGRSMASADRFHLASIAKTMTAAVLLQLAEEGAFGTAGIDATLASTGTLPPKVIDRLLQIDGQPCGHLLTLRHLLQHTGGLRDAMVDDLQQLGGPAPGSLIGALMAGRIEPGHAWRPWDAACIDTPTAGVLNFYLDAVADAGLAPPGQAFHYADTGFVLLGLVIEAVSGAALHAAYRSRLFGPLGMPDSYLAYTGDPPGMRADRLPESEPWMGAMPCLSAGVSLSFDWAGGGVVSTAADLARFLRGLLDVRLFRQPETLAAMRDWTRPPGLRAPRTGVGLGLFRTQLRGKEFIGHSGAWGSKMFAVPARDLLVTGSLNRGDAPDDWHAQLVDALLASTV
jgi:D-alanyl-D-alanine carboxypeptidase